MGWGTSRRVHGDNRPRDRNRSHGQDMTVSFFHQSGILPQCGRWLGRRSAASWARARLAIELATLAQFASFLPTTTSSLCTHSPGIANQLSRSPIHAPIRT